MAGSPRLAAAENRGLAEAESPVAAAENRGLVEAESPVAAADSHVAQVESRPHIMRKRMTRGVVALSAFSLAGSAVNYASNLAFARVLSPASYGDLTSLLALSVVIAVPFTAAQTRVASRVAIHAAEGRWDRVQYAVRHALAHLTVIALVATLVYCAAIPLVVDALSSPGRRPGARPGRR